MRAGYGALVRSHLRSPFRAPGRSVHSRGSLRHRRGESRHFARLSQLGNAGERLAAASQNGSPALGVLRRPGAAAGYDRAVRQLLSAFFGGLALLLAMIGLYG